MIDSTTKFKYIALSNALKKEVWIKKFYIELGMVSSIVDPIQLHYNNNRAITQAKKASILPTIETHSQTIPPHHRDHSAWRNVNRKSRYRG